MEATTENFPATSPPLPDDYSDVASVHSEDEASDRRKYPRGGRKKATTKSRIPPVPESQIARDPEHREELKAGETETQQGPCPECAARKQKTEAEKKPTPFETGIRAFNLKKAASSGGRPVGVRTTSSESKKSKKKSAKKKTTKKKKPEPEVKESESEEESSSEEEEEERKPMSIKLDLNLVIEIFLKAKIQGDVTITFLE